MAVRKSLNTELITFEQARHLLTKCVQPLAPSNVGIGDAFGLRLAGAVQAVVDLPPEDVAVMDGYAARTSDTGAERLPVSISVRAGMERVELPPAAVARIQTGAVIPDGADAVVAQEQAVVGSDGRVFLPAAQPGQFIRRAGEIRAAGDSLAEAGQLVTSRVVGLLAAAGPPYVSTIPRPRLAILTSGSELVGPAHHPGHGKIRDSNTYMLRSLAAEAHLRAMVLERIADSRNPLLAAVRSAALGADLVVTSGGVSVGDYDLIRSVIEDLGGKVLFHRVAIRPGKPSLVARLGDTWVVGLPGNPLSALVGWHVFVRPLAERLAGQPSAFDWTSQEATLAEATANHSDRVTFAPAVVSMRSGAPDIQVLRWKGSHDLAALSLANALAILAPGFRARAGDAVPFFHL